MHRFERCYRLLPHCFFFIFISWVSVSLLVPVEIALPWFDLIFFGNLGILKKNREDLDMTTNGKKSTAETLHTPEVRLFYVLIYNTLFYYSKTFRLIIILQQVKYSLLHSGINWLLAHLLFCRCRFWSLIGGQHLGGWSHTWRIVLKWCWMMFVPRVYSRKRPYILPDTLPSPWAAFPDTPPSLPTTHISEKTSSTRTQRERLPKW